MRWTLRIVLLSAGAAAAVLCLSVHGRSVQTDAGWETVVTVGAVGPWAEYTATPRGSSFQVNLLTWSGLCGVIALGCLRGYRALRRPGGQGAEPGSAPDRGGIR